MFNFSQLSAKMGAKHSSSSELTLVRPSPSRAGTDPGFSKEGAPTLQGKGDANIQFCRLSQKKMLQEIENIVVCKGMGEGGERQQNFPKTS